MRKTFYYLELFEREYFSKAFPDASLYDGDFSGNEEDAEIVCIRGKSAFFGADAIKKFPSIRFLATRSVGMDNVDLEACKSAGVEVRNAPGYANDAVSSHALKMLEKLGVSLKKKKLGLVGAGRIGRKLAEKAIGLGAAVVAYDVVKDEAEAKRIGFKYVELGEVLACDVVSVHVPLLPQTRHLVNAEALKKMGNGAVLVNTARGGIVDEAALLKELPRLGGACLDVVEGDDFDSLTARELASKSNVVLTRHEAFNSREALRKRCEITERNIRLFEGEE